ncbi:hypothetical protein HRbin33_01271 [bacterium HR33]|nr:hypothetical protein HRbin33_01271 [bacterium HR33]
MHPLAIVPALALAVQLQIPQPVGFVNDFANVIDPASERAMLALIEEVRSKSGGQIVVVTLPDLGGRPSIEVARDIGRQWGVGARGGPGDRARNAGVVLLLKPGRRPGDGQAELAIATGTGAEGFITDARAGRIRDAIGEAAVRTGSYAAGLVVGVQLLAEAYAEEFGFELTGAIAQQPGPAVQPSSPMPAWVAIFFLLLPVILFLVLAGASRRYARIYGGSRGTLYYGPSPLEWILLGALLGERRSGRHSRGGWFGGGWGGGLGGFGGGFGGFGGGGGFSGGGASGKF